MEYALYKGDEFICIGTLKEIAEFIDVKYETIKTYKSKKGIYNYVFVKLGKK